MPGLAPFKRLSLVARILIMVGLTLALTYPLSIFLVVNSQLALYRSTIAGELAITLETLERTIGEQVIIGDYALIEQILRARVRNSHFVEIDYTDGDGNVVTATEPQPATEYPAWFRSWFDLPEKPVQRRISVGGKDYGQVTVWLSHVGFRNEVWRTMAQQAALVAGVGAILFIVIALVLKRGLMPLRVVTELARSLRRGEYQCLAVSPASAAPEIRDTLDTFNDAASREAWLARFAEIISSGDPTQEKVRSVMKLLCARLDMQGAALACPNERGEFLVRAGYHASPAAETLHWEEFARQVLAQNAPLVVDRRARHTAQADMRVPAAYIGVPARMGSRRGAVFSLFAPEPIALPNRNGEIELMGLCADWIGATIAEEEREQEMREQKEHVETVLDNVAEGIATLDLSGVIVSANPSMEQIFASTSRQLIGRPITYFVPGLKWHSLYAHIAMAEQGQRRYDMTWQEEGRRSDGAAILIEMSVRAVHSANTWLMVAVIRDVTERIRVEEALRESEARRKRAQEIAQLGSLELFPETGKSRWSAELCRILGVDSGSDPGYADFISRVDYEDRERVRAAFDAGLAQRQAFNVEFRVARPAGERRFVMLSAEAPAVSEQGTRLFAVVQDITDHKQAEAQVRAALVEKLQAEAHNRAKTLFLANMSHELRTPLNAILGYSEMLEEEALSEGRGTAASDLQKIRSAGKHLLAMINEVLDLSKIEAGRIDLVLEECPVRPLLDDVLATIEPLAAKNRNTLNASFDPGERVMQTDTMKVKQVLINLLGNACKFTSDGEISFVVTHEVDAGAEWMRFTVRDTGIGMTTEQLDHLFEPFVQADASTARKYGGTGLGLAISKRYVEILGGEISVDSIPQRGSTFSVRLPLDSGMAARAAAGAESMARIVEATVHRTSAHSFSNRRSRVATVLVVEADTALRELMERHLSAEGFRVVSLGRAEEALALARQHQPSLMVLDAEEAGFDVFEVVRQLKGDSTAVRIPVVLLGSESQMQEARRFGAEDYLGKPINWQVLAAIAKKWARAGGLRAPGNAPNQAAGGAAVAGLGS